jgi:hypothetical protein
MRDRPLEPTGMNLCQRCSHAVRQLLLDFMTSADELHKTSVQCDLCRLLLKVIGGRLPKGMMTGPLRIRRKASKITVQRGSNNYILLTIRKIPGRDALNVHIIGLRRLTSGWNAQKLTNASHSTISKSGCLPCAGLTTLNIHNCCSHGCEIATQSTLNAARISVRLEPKQDNTQRDSLPLKSLLYGWSIPGTLMTAASNPSGTSLFHMRGATRLSTNDISPRRTPTSSTARPYLNSRFRTSSLTR